MVRKFAKPVVCALLPFDVRAGSVTPGSLPALRRSPFIQLGVSS